MRKSMSSPYRLTWQRAFVAGCYLNVAALASALGVSDIDTHSRLGEPFSATITLTHPEPLTEGELKVALADPKTHAQMQVELDYIDQQLRFELGTNNRLRVYSRDPIKEPYLNFVLQFRWPEGELVREYKVFLDPPMQ